MTSGLRKVHKFSWVLIAIGGIVFLFFTIQELNFQPQESSKTNENEQIKISMRSHQVEVIVKSSLKTSSSVVYEVNSKGERGEALGQVGAVGIYTFNTNNPIQGIVIVDQIKDVELTKLNF